MKRKLILILIIAAVLAAGVIFAMIMRKSEKKLLHIDGKEISVKVMEEDGETYISAEDAFCGAQIEYEEAKGKITVKGEKTLEIDTAQNNVKVSGEEVDFEYKTNNGTVMISPYLAGEVVGGEVIESENEIYIIKTEPVFVTFRENGKQIEFEYSDKLFEPSAYEYNHALAKISLGAAVAAFSSKEADKFWGDDGDFGRDVNIKKLYEDMGFSNIKTYNYDKSLNDTSDKAAFAIAQKKIRLSGKEYRIVALSVRGGAYGNEWVSNFNLGTGDYHEGFSQAANEVKAAVLDYVGSDLKDTKLWITGFSRGAAVANLAAARLYQSFDKGNIYAYTFATPKGTAKTDKKDEKYGYIYNIISENDLIPLVAPSKWGFGRYGNDISLPTLSKLSEDEAKKANQRIFELYQSISQSGEFNLSEIENSNQSKQVLTTVESICKAVKSRENYASDIAPILMDFIECSNTKIKNKNGNWKWVSAKTGIKHKFSKSGEEMLEAAQNNSFLRGVEAQFGDMGEAVTAFGAICIKYGKNPQTVITEEIGVANFITIASIFDTSSTISGTIARAHYPESYIATLLGFPNAQNYMSK